MADDHGDLQLPADTMALLQQFHDEKDVRAEQFAKLKSRSETQFDDSQLNMSLFGEDWNASQFWYTDETARTLAEQLLDGADADSAIAVVSAPSVYIQLRKVLHEDPTRPRPRLCLLEYDRRFEVLGDDFVAYNFEQALKLPADLKGVFDRIICDPPFLSEDCQTKTALTVRYLARSWKPASSCPSIRFISCTGERMAAHILKLYGKIGTETTTFEPKHTKGLSNEFWCYANFECPEWTWRSSKLDR